MATGYDQRIAAALVALGYDYFPFEAFDSTGHVIIPDRVQYPGYLKDGLGRVSEAPAWAELFRTISILGNPQWDVYSAGLGFSSTSINVAVFKSTITVDDAYSAHEWSRSYHEIIASTIQGFAGTRYAVDPRWVGWLNEAIDRLPSSERINDPAEGVVSVNSIPAPTGEHTPTPMTGQATEAFSIPWLLLGLRAMLGLFERLTVKPSVRSTIWWYSSAGTTIDLPFARGWIPIHVDYMGKGNKRTVHGLWETNESILPQFWRGSEVPWDRFGWAMPHQLWQWCRAMYPQGRCGGPGLIQGSEAVGQAAPIEGIPSGIEESQTDGTPID